MRALCALLAISLTTSAAATPPQPNTASAKAFVERVYAPYIAGDTKVDWLGASAPKVFAPSLLRLIHRDQEGHPGEVGALDGDPICNCQDFEAFTRFALDVRRTAPTRARATVRFHNLDHNETIRLDLVAARGRWLIADVGSSDMPSLVAFLKRAAADRDG